MRRRAGALRLQVGDVFRAIEQIEHLAEGRRGRILIDKGNVAEMVTAVDILVQEHRPNVSEIGIDDGGFGAEQPDGAANAHRRDRRIDLQALAGMGDLSGDEGEGAFHQAENGAVRRAVVGLEVYIR